MLSAGQDVEVSRIDLQAALGPLRVGRCPPRRFALSKVVSLHLLSGNFVIATTAFDAAIECRGVWHGTVMVDAWLFRRIVSRLPSVDRVRLVGWEGRLAVVTETYRHVLAAVDVQRDIVFRRFFRRLYPAPVEELPLFRRKLL